MVAALHWKQLAEHVLLQNGPHSPGTHTWQMAAEGPQEVHDEPAAQEIVQFGPVNPTAQPTQAPDCMSHDEHDAEHICVHWTPHHPLLHDVHEPVIRLQAAHCGGQLWLHNTPQRPAIQVIHAPVLWRQLLHP